MISSPELRGEIRKQMDIRRWDSEDLGRATGYAGSTVRKYMVRHDQGRFGRI